jgi:signal transduction histidine kinase
LKIPGKGTIEGCCRIGCTWESWDDIEKKGAEPYIEICVADNGCGIHDEHFNKIFDPFFTTKQKGGTGLGLAVVWGIIDNHQGTIEIRSKPGEGTAVYVRLPTEESMV